MAETVHIPRGDWDAPGPCWIAVTDGPASAPVPAKPIIKCQCGEITGIGLHAVHADGRVTASFFHAQEPNPCQWHVYLVLDSWIGLDFPPREGKR